jgi:c-di-GMP-binding flagellar brake protein YcgR
VPITLPQSNQPLAVWERIEIVIGEDHENARYVARIEDFIPEGIVVSRPEFVQGSVRLRDNCEVRGFITRKDAVYEFYSRIKKHEIGGQELFLLVSPRYFKRVQRRQFVRVELSRDVTYAVIKQKGGAAYDGRKLEWHEAKTQDVSGGGALMKGKDEIPVGTVILIKSRFFMEIGLPVTVAAVSRRCCLDKGVHLCGAEFLKTEFLGRYFSDSELTLLPESIQFFDLNAQNRLVRFTFDQQLDLRKKGLL